MKTHLIVDIFEIHILYRNGCQNDTCIGGGGIVNKVQKGGDYMLYNLGTESLNGPKLFQMKIYHGMKE